MLLTNHSVMHTTKSLKPLFDFVAKRFDASRLVSLVVNDRDDGEFTGGEAFFLQQDAPFNPRHPSCIELFLSQGLAYPRAEKHPIPTVSKKTGFPTIGSWEEEIVFVLAHELQHITDFWALRKFPNITACEVSAEIKALKVLEEFRTTPRKKTR